jgi:hypothetical protein
MALSARLLAINFSISTITNNMFLFCFLLSLLLSLLKDNVSGFTAAPTLGSFRCVDRRDFCQLRSAAESESSADVSTLSLSEEKVYYLLKELHDSALKFRIVVVGSGAILESTNLLGPTMKINKSPATGANLVTFASEDQSFEFHFMIASVSKVAIVEKKSPVKEGKIMRVMRFLNGEEKSICSLILADDSTNAATWYQGVISKYGPELSI